MSSNRKQARKQKKQHDRKRRKAKSQARSKQSFPPTPHIPDFSQPPPKSELDLETLSPIDRWWNDYSGADGPQRLQMTRDKLLTVSLDDDWFESLFPEAISDLRRELPECEYVAFLEELCDEHPDVFALDADWHASSMVSYYISEGRMEDVDRATKALASMVKNVSSPFFSLISLVRLAGRAEAAQRLMEAVTPLIDELDLMPWAIDELIELTLFEPVQACIRAGTTDEAIEKVFQMSIAFGAKDTIANREIQRNHIAHIAGTSEKIWSRDELLAADKNAGREIYVLLYDYMRWLCEKRDFQPIVADELRRILADTVNNLKCEPNALLRGLKRADFEPALVRKLDFMSLTPFHAPAAIVAMRHFYDFLHAHDLVDTQTRETAHTVCYVLWRTLKKVMAKEWDKCRFLEAYLPSAVSLSNR